MLHNIDYFGFIYKWTNNRNKKYYIGSHHGPTDDGYIGSGIWFRRAYNTEPTEFTREILEYITSNDPQLTLEVEQRYLTEICEVGNKDKCYNISRKSGGGWQLHAKSLDERDEIYKRISESLLNRTPEEKTIALEKARHTIASEPEKYAAAISKGKETKSKWTTERKQLMVDRMKDTLAKHPEITRNAVEKCKQTVAARSEEDNIRIKKNKSKAWTEERKEQHSNNIQIAIANRSQEDKVRIKAKQSLAQLARDPASKEAAHRKAAESFKNRSPEEKALSETRRKEKWLAKKAETIAKMKATKNKGKL